MITLNDANTDNIHLNTCITGSIPLINLFSLNMIGQLRLIAVNYNAEILSTVSLMDTQMRLMLDNFTTIQNDMFVSTIMNNIMNSRNINMNALSIISLQTIIDAAVNNLSELKTKIEDTYHIQQNSLSIYSDLNSESGINYLDEKSNSPIIFNYYEGKVLLKKIISLISGSATIHTKYNDNEQSLGYSFIDKSNNTLDSLTKEMQQKILLSDSLEEIVDSCTVASATIQKYDLQTQAEADLFLSRKYSIIKENVIIALREYL